MKKRKIKNYFKLGILLIGFLITLTNCEQEEIIVQKDSVYKTVSKLEVLEFLNSYEKNKTSNRTGRSIDLKYDITSLKYESLINSKEFLAVIPANTIHKSVYSRILLIKENNEIHAVLFNMFSTELNVSNSFSGIIQITDLNGNFINGYRVKEGKFTSQFFKEQLSKKGNKLSKSTSIDCGCGNGEFCLIWTQNLNEITINANSGSATSPVSLGGLIGNYYNIIDNEYAYWEWDGGGNPPPINPIDCETGYTKDIYGNCVKNESNPCNKVFNLMNDSKTKAISDTLSTKIYESREYGYSKNKDGNWQQGTVSNNGHSIDLGGNSSVGFLHTHTNNINSVHMLSDTDIVTYLSQVRHAFYNGIEISSVIGGMISASGTYVMTYNGDILSDRAALGGWTEKMLRDEYLKIYDKSGGDMTKLFYDFINKLGIKGITLTKRQSDGTYKKSVLNADGTSKEEEC
ncbi:MAG: hypothetical protein KGZ87_07960 [Bacteroidetes bacterium]|nr:hypothetical protein [Bacteroidota bacterium]